MTTPLPGSTARQVIGSIPTAEVPEGEFEVTVVLRRKQALPSNLTHALTHPGARLYLTGEDIRQSHGASPDDIDKVTQFAVASGLRVLGSNAGTRHVYLSGTAEHYGKAFGVELRNHCLGDAVFRGREGEIHLPDDLSDIVTCVAGLDNPPLPVRRRRARRGSTAAPRSSDSPADQYTSAQFADFYNFPADTDGSGQTVILIEFGGGYLESDLKAYFDLPGLAMPNITVGAFNGCGTNNPGHDADADTEVTMDIEVLGGAAPGAKIIVCFAIDQTEQGWIRTISEIVDQYGDDAVICSLSWGLPEQHFSDQTLLAINETLLAAALKRVTFCVASGDDGSSDYVSGPAGAHVDFPASSRYVLACGGTTITSVSPLAETVWSDGPQDSTGGGVSRFFNMPLWQYGSGVPMATNPEGPIMRGVPDVAAAAADNPGYTVIVNGERKVASGTSCAAPLWAALLARLNQALDVPVGFIPPKLYGLPGTQAFHDITQGSNGDYSAGPGWDPCTGLGTPDGTMILEGLKEEPVPIYDGMTPYLAATRTTEVGSSGHGSIIQSQAFMTDKAARLSFIQAALFRPSAAKPLNRLILSLQANNDGVPGEILEQWSVSAGLKPPDGEEIDPWSNFQAISRKRPVLRSGLYWFGAGTEDGSLYYYWRCADVKGLCASSYDGFGGFQPAHDSDWTMMLSVFGVPVVA